MSVSSTNTFNIVTADVPVYEGSTSVSVTNSAIRHLLSAEIVGCIGATAAQVTVNGSNVGSNVTVNSKGKATSAAAAATASVPAYDGNNGAKQANQTQGVGYAANWQSSGTAQLLNGKTQIVARDGAVPAPGATTPLSSSIPVGQAVGVTFTGTINDPDVNGTVVGGTVTNKALTSNVATLTTASAHGLKVGDVVVVAISDAVFDGTKVVTAVTSTTFSYAKTDANVTSAAATGTATLNPKVGTVRFVFAFPTSADPNAAGKAAKTYPDNGVQRGSSY